MIAKVESLIDFIVIKPDSGESRKDITDLGFALNLIYPRAGFFVNKSCTRCSKHAFLRI